VSAQKKPLAGSTIQRAAVSDAGLRGLFGYNLKRTFNAIQGDLALTLRPFELRMITYSLLAVIVETPGVRQSQLAEVLAIERPNLVVLLDELEGRELITRERELADRRAYALTTTLAGRRLYDKAREAVLAHEKQFLRQLSTDETNQITAALRLIERNVKGGS
jgi:DNA-binding MarR family transcriptional regulator